MNEVISGENPRRSLLGIGVDGCKGGWFFVRLGAQEPAFGVVSRITELLDQIPKGSAVLVDIPIGLREADDGERLCDVEARRLLAPGRSSSVFSPPCRQALYAASYEEALIENRAVVGKGLSRQSWGIAAKIREMDHLLQDSAKARMVVHEAHPEVCFRGLSGAPMRYAKKKREGFRERLECLSRHLPGATAIAAGAFLEHGGYEVGRDDVLDALVLAFCASQAPDCRTLPETPERDPRGLRMEMVYLPAERSDQQPNPLPPGRSP